MNENKLERDALKMITLISFVVAVVYYMPTFLNYFLFAAIVAIILSSRKYDYFWVAFWFIIIDCPGGLFEMGNDFGHKQLPFISIFGGVISLRQIIPLVFLIKVIIFKKDGIIVLRKDFIFLLFMFLGYFVLGFIYGMSVNSIFNTVLVLISWTLLFSLPRILSYSTIINLDRILFPIVFLAFLSQLYTMVTGITLVQLISGIKFNSDYLAMSEQTLSRYVSGAYIILYVLMKSLYYSFNKNNPFSSSYIQLIIAVSLFSIFLSGTRGWIIASIILLLLTLLTQGRGIISIKKPLLIGLFSGSLILIAIIIIPALKTQIIHVIDRVMTFEQVVQGDFTMDGSLVRVTTRAPKVLAPFYNKMLLGEGFSNVYWNTRDRHVGHAVILLNNGIVGYLVMLFFFIKWTYKIYSLPSVNIGVRRLFGNSPRILSYGFIFIFFIHSTSHMFWGFDIELGPLFAIVLLLTSYNEIIVSGQMDITTPKLLSAKK